MVSDKAVEENKADLLYSKQEKQCILYPPGINFSNLKLNKKNTFSSITPAERKFWQKSGHLFSKHEMDTLTLETLLKGTNIERYYKNFAGMFHRIKSKSKTNTTAYRRNVRNFVEELRKVKWVVLTGLDCFFDYISQIITEMDKQLTFKSIKQTSLYSSDESICNSSDSDAVSDFQISAKPKDPSIIETLVIQS